MTRIKGFAAGWVAIIVFAFAVGPTMAGEGMQGMQSGMHGKMHAPTKGDQKTAGQGKEYFIKMKYNEDDGTVYFEPARIKVSSGDTVTWIQTDDVNEHNVVSYANGIPKGAHLFEGPLLDEVGQKYSVTFTKSGTYRYHCHPHEALGMKGVVIVDRESRPDEFRTAKPSEMHHHQGMSDDDDDAGEGHDGDNDHDSGEHGGGHGH